ncbi:MAG: hypothetical protein JWP73_1177, partial [Phenylobacterium sp.]|nr:hypothetical protein [Phenylobacterium sp.]
MNKTTRRGLAAAPAALAAAAQAARA